MFNLNDKLKNSLKKVEEMFKNPASDVAVNLIFPKPNSPSANWSFLNRCIMVSYNTGDARGFRQWESVGRKVKKGARAFYIFAPLTKSVEKIEEKENGEKIIKKSVRLCGFKCVPVFRYEDTEGEDLYTPDRTPPPLKDVAEQMGYEVIYSPTSGRYHGYYTESSKKIVLCDENEITFFHEFAHAIVGKLGIYKNDDKYNMEKNEIVAEGVAAILSAFYGLDSQVPQSNKYISYYSKNNDPFESLMGYIGDISKVIKFLEPYLQGEQNYGNES